MNTRNLYKKITALRLYIWVVIGLGTLCGASAIPTTTEIQIDENTAQINKWQIECLDETKIDPNQVVLMKGGYWKSIRDESKKWCLCLLVRAGMMSLQGVYRLDEAMTYVTNRMETREDLLKRIDKCLFISDKKRYQKPDVIAFRYLKCINSKEPKKFAII